MKHTYRYNLGQLFSNVAQQFESKSAIQEVGGNTISYSTLEALSNQLAEFILVKSVQPGEVVIILNDKSPMAYALMLACLKLGVTYSNLDPKSPIERFNRMLDICNAQLLFYFEKAKSIVEESNYEISKSFNYGDGQFLTELENLPNQLPEINQLVTANSAAYIMFTSGSTGFPKGVVISHQNVLNFIEWSRLTYHTKSSDVFTNINPMHFDNSVFDFYSSLFTGASMVPVTEQLTRNPRKLLDALNEVHPTIWFSVPSMLVYVLNMRALKPEDLPTLRIVTYGGEGFPKNQLRKLWDFWGNRVRFVNVYGPTECTCICSSYDVSEEDLQSDELLPLGHMAPNFYGLVLNEKSELCESGEIGELLIGGPNVGLGYFNNVEKTNEVFIADPRIEEFTSTVYKSGDLVKQDPTTKQFHFCGRKDNQIKRMGYRIELEEIENAFNAISTVKESAVIYLDNDKYRSKIIACLNASNQDEDKIKEVLKKYLPSYMIPDLYFYFESLPKNQNGKIDRLKLKEELNK